MQDGDGMREGVEREIKRKKVGEKEDRVRENERKKHRSMVMWREMEEERDREKTEEIEM